MLRAEPPVALCSSLPDRRMNEGGAGRWGWLAGALALCLSPLLKAIWEIFSIHFFSFAIPDCCGGPMMDSSADLTGQALQVCLRSVSPRGRFSKQMCQGQATQHCKDRERRLGLEGPWVLILLTQRQKPHSFYCKKEKGWGANPCIPGPQPLPTPTFLEAAPLEELSESHLPPKKQTHFFFNFQHGILCLTDTLFSTWLDVEFFNSRIC